MKIFDRRWLINILLLGSVVLNLAMIGYLANSGGLRRFFVRLDLVEAPKTRQEFQKEMEARFRKLPNTPAEIVFAGDSLVADGLWSEFFSEIHDRGIGGETTAGLLDRLDEIIESKPRQIFLWIGTNDLADATHEAQILRNYRAILDRLRKEAPQTALTVIAILPVNEKAPKPPTQTNAQISSVNRQLKALVGEFPGVRFVDLGPILSDESGQLSRKFSVDGVHLNLDGYLAILKPLEESIPK
jgi:lysophospholipase L1-like esterase